MTACSAWKRFSKFVAVVAVLAGLANSGAAYATVILFTAGADSSGGTNPQSTPATANPHIPAISPGVTLTPGAPILLGGVATGPLNGITYGPDAFGGGIGGTTGWVHVSYVLTAADVGLALFAEVANVGDTSFDSAMAMDRIMVNSVLVESFEAGNPYTTSGFVSTSGAVPNLAPTDGSFFTYLDTTGVASAVFDTIDGTTAGNFFASLGLSAGDLLEFDVAFLTNDGTASFHDYGIVSLGVPSVVPSVVPEPSSLALLGLGAVGFFGRRLRRKTPVA